MSYPTLIIVIIVLLVLSMFTYVHVIFFLSHMYFITKLQRVPAFIILFKENLPHFFKLSICSQ